MYGSVEMFISSNNLHTKGFRLRPSNKQPWVLLTGNMSMYQQMVSFLSIVSVFGVWIFMISYWSFSLY